MITRMVQIPTTSCTKEEKALDHIAKLLVHIGKISISGQVACVPFSGRKLATDFTMVLAVLVDLKELAPACG
jgi:hypothetical protein